ncbi:5-formyltetrahydrofolate cyclo-ligase [Leucobacter komagatae]|uniref:5-formyltetrahydrofolate cyclo-ligase n=1 Tax=Leucobacter komagatae TaxID=55969 RepID=A0A542Y668_9MICO|nr:5-formyltetrahydrofolate cyclo-ligase [Leucobacter komagatae]TQL43581.1 5-formyltetrahydrofolate cyclo-ligase [Leucobacter komagatae]
MDDKQLLRKRIRGARAERVATRTAAEARAHAASFTEQLTRLTQGLGAQRVACFVSHRGEPDTADYITWALDHGVEIMLPRSLADNTLEWALHERGALAPGPFGIPEPTGPALPSGATATADLLLIPAAAVDEGGWRLGWGRGFYDRELAALGDTQAPASDAQRGRPRPTVFAVVWEAEVVGAVPREAHDAPVDGVVTEERVRHFG